MPPLAAAALTVGLLSAALWGGLFATYRAQASDALFPLGAASNRVVVVGIDRRALDATSERWPWPRSLQARLIDRIAAASPALIVVDIVFSPASAEDAVLHDALQRAGGPIVASLAELAKTADGLYQARVLTTPAPSVATGLLAAHGAVTPDPLDGVIRSVPLLVEAPDHTFVPSLSLAAFARMENLPEIATLRPHGVQVGDRFIPTDRSGRLRVGYSSGLSGRGAGRSVVSAADVLAGTVPAERLAGKAVFVGVTDLAVGDRHATPMDKGSGAPGVMIHANAMSTMLTRNYTRLASGAETLLWMAFLAVGVAASTARFPVWLAAITAGAASGGYVLLGFARFDSGTAMDLVFPPLAVWLALLASLGARVLAETAEQRRVAGLLAQYVPTPVAKHMLARGRASGLPTAAQLTFLLTDVVGSTELWEASPRDMTAAMRRHDALIEQAVEAAGGAVVRPRGEGDSRFCVFVKPIDAVNAAVAIDRAITSERWPARTPVRVRIGIHTGEAELREADYYGSAVNRCARIRGVAGPGQIMLSSMTAALVRNDVAPEALIDQGKHELRGLSEPEHLFELLPQAHGIGLMR